MSIAVHVGSSPTFSSKTGIARRWRLLLVVLLALLPACSRAPGEKVAVLVNGEPITIREVRAQRDSMPSRDAKQAVDSLIDRRLLLQHALARSLDRNPDVEAAIAAARERVLVQAYLESVADSHYRFDPAEIHSYYEAHPALFAKRRIYRLFELAAAPTGEKIEGLKATVKKARTIYDVAEWLSARGVPFNIGAATKPAEQIRLDLLPILAAMRDGEIKAVPIENGVSVVQVVHSELQPISEEGASSAIRQHLWSLAGAKAVPDELKWLRSKAKIEYPADTKQAKTVGNADSLIGLRSP